METAFPGSSKTQQKYDISVVELTGRRPSILNGLCITPFSVNHGMPEGSCFAYRIEVEDRIIAYTGDTEWTDTLIEVGRNADLFIAEAYKKAESLDTEKFIDALEGLQVQSPAGRIEMRACDHQAILPMYFGVTKLSPELGVAISTDIHTLRGAEVMPSCAEIMKARGQ